MTKITPQLLVQSHLADSDTANKIAESLSAACERFGIDTPEAIAMFLAQAAHESGHFKSTVENLNYSADRLRAVWPARFPSNEAAAPYHRNPEMIANKVYSSRMGNGDEYSGEGFKFRGRGYFQLTGKSNYSALAIALNMPEIMDNPDLVAEPEVAALSAAWFWRKNNLDACASDVTTCTKKINGGAIGLDDRAKLYAQALTAVMA
jgi:putative chitinase